MRTNKTISSGEPHKIIGIDDSGNLGRSGTFYILTAVQLHTRKDFMSLRNVFKKTMRSNPRLRSCGEIKSNVMNIDEKRKLFKDIKKKDINFSVWLYIINTQHFEYANEYISKKGNKKKFFIRTLNDFLQHINQDIQETRPLTIEVDRSGIRQGVDYKNADIKYEDSGKSYRIQLADFIGSAVYGHYEYRNSEDIYVKFYEDYVEHRVQAIVQYPSNSKKHTL